MIKSHKARRKRRHRQSATRMMWLVCILVLLACLWVNPPKISSQYETANRTQAMRNMRAIGLAMLEFDQEYGSFPNDETAKAVMESTDSELDFTGPHSNAYFRQLIAYGIQSEYIFYATHPEGSHRPDRLIAPGHALAPGEVGMSYVYDLNTSLDPGIPLLLAPMKTGTHLAWRKPLGKKAAVLLLDNSIHGFELDRQGQILLEDGSLLLDPAQAYWNGRPIDLRHPEFP